MRQPPRRPPHVQAWIDRDNARIRDVIRRCGWSVEYVFGEEGSPAFGYTVGLWELGHAELVTFGACPDCAARVLNRLGSQIRDGVWLSADSTPELDGTPLLLFDVPNPHQVILGAWALYVDDEVPALQVVYPDDEGRWPWEPGCSLRPGGQPLPGDFIA